MPGLYYLRLLKDYKDLTYKWTATDWETGDTGRVSQNDFTYNEDNTITIKAGTGANNLCLSFNHEKVNDALLQSSQKYLAVIATNVRTTAGSAYLWWLNGVNKGSSVTPTKIQKLSDGTCFIWDMTKSGINDNNSGDTFSISQGATIFGLTSTTGTSVIKHIGFFSSMEHIEEAVSIKDFQAALPDHAEKYISADQNTFFTLNGIATTTPQPNGIYIKNGKKIIFSE